MEASSPPKPTGLSALSRAVAKLNGISRVSLVGILTTTFFWLEVFQEWVSMKLYNLEQGDFKRFD
jgi:hypothetical protein